MSQFSTGNIYSGLPGARQPDELFEALAGDSSSQVKIERIVSQGHASPEGHWYDQDQHEWVMVLQGEAVLAFEGREDVRLRPGDYVCIPARLRHRVAWTAPATETIWLAVFF